MTPIRTGLEPVVRADRNVDVFLEVPVYVAEPQVVRAVLVDVESLLYRRDALAVPVPRWRDRPDGESLSLQEARNQEAADRDGRCDRPRNSTCHN